MTGDTPRRDIPAVSVVPLITVWSFLARSRGRPCCRVCRGGWCSAELRGSVSAGAAGRHIRRTADSLLLVSSWSGTMPVPVPERISLARVRPPWPRRRSRWWSGPRLWRRARGPARWRRGGGGPARPRAGARPGGHGTTPPRRNAEQHQAADVAGPADPPGDRDQRDRAHAAQELSGRGRPPADPGSDQGNIVRSGDRRPEQAYEGGERQHESGGPQPGCRSPGNHPAGTLWSGLADLR